MRNRQLRLAILKEYDSQSDFAEEVGTSASTISLVVNGRRLLTEKEIVQWHELLNCDYKTIYEVAA